MCCLFSHEFCWGFFFCYFNFVISCSKHKFALASKTYAKPHDSAYYLKSCYPSSDVASKDLLSYHLTVQAVCKHGMHGLPLCLLPWVAKCLELTILSPGSKEIHIWSPWCSLSLVVCVQIALSMLPSQFMKHLQANRQTQRIPRTP